MRYISIIVYLFCCLNCYGQAQDIRFRKITSNQGLSHNTVYAITQDAEGFMWFGTREGLNRYDSYEIKNYYIKNAGLGESANKISSLLCHNSLIYVGTDNGLYVYDAKTNRLQDSRVSPNKLTVLFLFEWQQAIYVGTTTGLYKLWNNRFELISRKNSAAKAMCLVADDYFLLAANNNLELINSKGQVQRVFNASALEALSRNDFNVFNIYKDAKGRIWLSTNYGLYNYNPENQRFNRIQFATTETRETNTVRSVSRKQNTLFIGTEDGLYLYNLKTGHSGNYLQAFNSNPRKLNDKAIYSTYIAKDGSVWLGTYFGGVNYIPPSDFGFRTLMPNDKINGLSGKAISQMMEDSQHHIWIGTEDGGIAIYNPATDAYMHVNKTSSPFYLTVNNVHAIHDDGYGNIWVGTFLGGLHQFDIRSNKTIVYTHQPGNAKSLSNDMVYAVYRDSRGVLWVATQNGLNIFNYQTRTFSLFRPSVFGNKFIYDIAEDKNGDLWFCTRYDGIFRFNPINSQLTHYAAGNKYPVLKSNQVISVYKDSKQHLWFGTLDGGATRYDIDRNVFKTYTMADGLPNNNVYGILEDDNKDIWFTTNRGISRLNVQTGKFTSFDTKYGLPSNQFNFKSYLKTSEGLLYFGSINGVCFFNPAIIASRRTVLPLRFTDFQLFNQSVEPQPSGILENQIDYSAEVSLTYSQNVFTIAYAAINYANPGSTNYAYYLEGFENKWNYVGNKTSVTYTNLSPGKYVFHVKAVNADRTANSAERILKIRVSPPFYLSRVAYLLYVLLLLALVWAYARFIKFVHKKQLEVKLERLEKQKITEVTQHRLNFFTFISHEFKTPLTLILASIDKFIEEHGSQFRKSVELSSIKNNASILFKLIQQLMEFRKIETDHAAINLSKKDIVGFIRELSDSFITIAAKKGIELEFHPAVELFECYFDADKMEKICFNIISNAIKNTSSGKISVSLDIRDKDINAKWLTVMVKDTGRGMSAKELKNVFNPFYKSQENQAINREGSGIGLALVNSLVKYLGGEITIDSEVDRGTTIQITVPVMMHLNDADLHNKKLSVVTVPEQSPEPERQNTVNDNEIISTATDNNQAMQVKYTLLVVEDNKELLTFLYKHFSAAYHVITATNGLLALKKITKNPPDIIISDVKMPRMDGFELCRRIKNDKKYSYIPVILLSDSTTENIKIDGLDTGADAYLGKPFNLKELELLITNTIKSRVKLREYVIGIGKLVAENLPNNNKDQEFLTNLNDVLEKSFSDTSITIEDIAEQLHMSRTTLHLNLKRILNKSGTELLNEYRLKKAAIMLENDMPVNEVAYYCGYGDPNYFSRIFKKIYHKTPLAYKREYAANN
ncbi:response regulator [Pedobacter sp. BS3]|uniref:hybrid sensor histidine kinase/response regulator transcription factor n=1 Tax=Pedobacter sp. BS3 TaxID=2567937 RepID=UPI0011ED2042|nr:hybrid sensor histidine kinase/response regulator transcription factor [Pedobacter sp. BS3]TZF82281.1 response regulator [Pedobacter sp. BS3]